MVVGYGEVARWVARARNLNEQERRFSMVTDPKTRERFQVVQKGGKFYLKTRQRGQLIGPFDSVGDLTKQLGL